MDTLTIAAVTKIMVDYLLKIVSSLNLRLPGWAIHLGVVGTATGLMFAYSQIGGPAFVVTEVLQAAFAALGVDQFTNHLSAETRNASPTINR
jgi:hypothetical protein